MAERELTAATDDELISFMLLLDIEVLTADNLKEASRAMLRTHHTDKGGSLEMAQAITRATRLLSLCLSHGRSIPRVRVETARRPSCSTTSTSFDEHYAYAMNSENDEWQSSRKAFRMRKNRPKDFSQPTSFSRAFTKGTSEDPTGDPFETEIGKAMSRPKHYNNGYTYEDDDEFFPNDRQFYTVTGEPRVIRGGLNIRNPLKDVTLPHNYMQLARSDILLENLKRHELLTDPRMKNLIEILSVFEKNPTFDALIERSLAFVFMDWAAMDQSDNTPYRGVTLKKYSIGMAIIYLSQFEEDDIVDDRMKEGVIIRITSEHDEGLSVKATVKSVDWLAHQFTVDFMNEDAGKRLLDSGHKCDIRMDPSHFLLKAQLRGIEEVRKLDMRNAILPNPQFEEPLHSHMAQSEQCIHDELVHQRSDHATDVLFNFKQQQAIDTVVNGHCRPYPFILFGPPGTGKTATLVECIRRITRMDKKKRVLVCAPSNMAADVIAQHILRRNFIDPKYIFRLTSLSMDVKDRRTNLDNIRCIVSEGSAAGFGIPCLMNLLVYRVVITTLASSMYLNLAGGMRGYFSHIMIDESGQATEQETWLPIGGLAVPNVTTIALFGDTKQIGAVDRVPILRSFGYCTSMMERILQIPAYKEGDPRLTVLLEQNYRTHTLIIRPASCLFYEKKLVANLMDRSLYQFCGWSELPNPHFPIIFHSTRGSLEQRSETFSYMNQLECELCIKYVLLLHRERIPLNNIGIISPYNFQGQFVQDKLNSLGREFRSIVVKSVEGFQGSERDVIILLTTRTHSMGFLQCDKRLNTSITRARKLLIVLGDESLLENYYSWQQFIEYCRVHRGFRDPEEEKVYPDRPPGFENCIDGYMDIANHNTREVVEPLKTACGPRRPPPSYDRDYSRTVPNSESDNEDEILANLCRVSAATNSWMFR